MMTHFSHIFGRICDVSKRFNEKHSNGTSFTILWTVTKPLKKMRLTEVALEMTEISKQPRD